MDTAADISQVTDAARAAARVLANATTQVKNRGLEAIAAALIDRSDQILAANAEDVARGRAEQMSEGLLDRLALTPIVFVESPRPSARSRVCLTRSVRSCVECAPILACA